MPRPALTTADVGRLVTLRASAPEGAVDVVGTLLSVSPTEMTVRRRDGGLVTVAVTDVTHARVVPPGPAQTIDVLDLHRVMADGWRALEVERLGEWLMRASGGFTRRGNSALPVGDPGVGVEAAVDAVSRWYGDRGLTPRVQVPLAEPTRELRDALAAAGWSSDSHVHVMTAEVAPALRAPLPADAPSVQLDERPDDAWLSAYRRDAGPLPPVAEQLLAHHPDVVFASIRDGGECQAIARASVDGRWAGLFAVEVEPAHRRRGFGRIVSVAALRWAAQHRARRAYLQTEVGNDPAVALYRSLGFEVHHDYEHWRRQ